MGKIIVVAAEHPPFRVHVAPSNDGSSAESSWPA